MKQILGGARVRTAIFDVEKIFLIEITQVATLEPAVDGYGLPGCFCKARHQAGVEWWSMSERRETVQSGLVLRDLSNFACTNLGRASTPSSHWDRV